MEMRKLEEFLGGARVENLSIRRFLAAVHRGDAFTNVFSRALTFLAWSGGVLFGFVWLASWGRVYYAFERWELVLAFVDQFFLLGIVLVVLHVTYLRARHLRHIPAGNFVPLQATALILRWLGECVLILDLGAFGHALLGVPDPSWMSSLVGFEEDLKLGIKASSTFFAAGWLFLSFFVFTFFYALAGVIDVFLSIERNTRSQERPTTMAGEVEGRGREVLTRRDHATGSI